jgi:RimJ/RimL family protein N-acetyltransferase
MQSHPAMIHTRPIEADDMEFLFEVYASTRATELAATPWNETQKEAFLRQQFDAQHTYYQQQFRAASYEIVLAGDQPIGRFYIDRREREIRIIDISLLPQFCGQGIGSGLLKQIMCEAASARLPVSIHVEKYNPALRLYRRLGFAEIQDLGVYLLMQLNTVRESATDL